MKRILFGIALSLLSIVAVAQPYAVTFQVNMNEVIDPFTTPEVNGTFNGWCGACNGLTETLPGIWTTTIMINPGTYEYKFAYDNWAGQESLVPGSPCTLTSGAFTNRTLEVTGDVTIPLVCWGACLDCGVAPAVYDVTFQVDMSEYAGTFTTPEVNGAFNGWCGGCAGMTDIDNNDIWEVTISLEEGNYEYKYAHDAWTGQENLIPGSPCTITNGAFTNRTLEVTGDVTLPPVCWGECAACGALSTYDVTFQVDMTQYAGAFTTPEVNGTFNGWCGNCNSMTDANSDGIWDVTITLTEGVYEYKFSHDAWLGQENLTPGDPCTITTGVNTNRSLNLTADVVLPPVCWGSCSACVPATYDVTFRVDMNNVTEPFTTPEVNGIFNGWCGGCAPMSDLDDDGVWEITIPLEAGAYEYKFAYDSWAGQETLTEGSACTVTNFGFTNRLVNVSGDVVLPLVCWASCSDCGVVIPVYDITFQVDMNTVPGPYTTPEVNGNFNGWCGGCAPMTDIDNNGVWEITIPLQAGTYEYKFAYDSWSGQENLIPGSPCTITTGAFTNRLLNVSADEVLPVVCWGECSGCFDVVAVRFRVDMSNETVSPLGVHLAGVFQGWDPAGTPMTHMGFGIYEATVNLDALAYYEYKYVNGNAWGTDESVPAECSVGFNRYFTTGTTDLNLDVVCFGVCTGCTGCTDPLSTEYNPFAISDDGSCLTPIISGCTYPGAENYNQVANTDDGSCTFNLVSSCPADITGDGFVGLSDLLSFIGSYGSTCP